MRTNPFRTKHRTRPKTGFVSQWRIGLAPLLASLSLALALVLNAAPVAHADPAPSNCTVVGWGDNSLGQLDIPADLTDVVAVAASGWFGLGHSLALKSDGTVVGWGDNSLGQLDIPAGLSNVVAISVGPIHSLALKSDGTVVGWGSSFDGQLDIPAGLDNVVAISAGMIHNLALKSDGTVVGWGSNSYGQLDIPAGLSDVVAISAASLDDAVHSLALKSDGTVVGWGTGYYANPAAAIPAGLDNVVAIDAGLIYDLALKSDGTVVAWGVNESGALDIPAGLNNVVAIDTGYGDNVALKSDGTVVGWGMNFAGVPAPPADLTNVVAIAAGISHGLALVCTPLNTPPELTADNVSVTTQQDQTVTSTGAVSDLDGDAVSLSASVGTVVNNGDGTWSWSFTPTRPGGQNVTIFADDGNGGASETSFILYVTAPIACSVVGWGDNSLGQLDIPADLTDVVAVAASGWFGLGHSLALKSDGTVVGWGDNSLGQLDIPADLTDVVAISVGPIHSLALKSDGTVVGWGSSFDGQLDIPAGLDNVVAISAGMIHNLALKSDGTVVGWGSNSYGQLDIPAGLSDVVAISAASLDDAVHSLALKSDGTVVGWGTGYYANPAAAIPAGLDNVVAIDAGLIYDLALKSDGTVVAWGVNESGALDIPAGLNGVMAIDTGYGDNVALKSDGTVVGWGMNFAGIGAPPAELTNVVAIAAGINHSLAALSTCVPSNTAPAAMDDTYSTNEDTTLDVAAPGVLANDSDADGDTLTAQPMTSPAHGSLTLNTDGSFTYTPDANFNGADSFTYVANDGMVDSAEKTVNITVNAANDAPVAAGDSYSTAEDTTLDVAAPGVLANDSDVEGDTISAVLVSGPANGSLTLNSDGSFSYTPAANFNGSDSFTYKANDGQADSGVTTVDITVNAVNDAPVAANDSYSTDEDTALTVGAPGVLANDSDVENDALSVELVNGPAHGTLMLNGDGSFSYTPAANFNGSDSFTYQVNDGMADSNTATVAMTVNPVNDAPVAANDSYLTDEDVPLTVDAPGVQENDNDVDGDTLTSAVVDNPAHGSVTLNGDGSFTYTPSQDYNGSDSFIYKLNDGAADSNTATVTIVIGGVNDAPVATDDSYATDEDTTLTVVAPGVLANDSDVDGDALTLALVDAPLHGTLSLSSDGSFSYTPAANFNGSDSFTYQVNDGAADSDIATVDVTVNAVNDAPVAANDSYATNEDVALTVAAPGLMGNDSDADGDTLSATLVGGPAHGSLTLNGDGSFSYTPATNFNGSDSFTYKLNDGQADSGVATVDIAIAAVNDPPVAGNDSYSTNQNTPLSVSTPGVLSNDSDPVESSPVSAMLVSGPLHGTLTLYADGSLSYTPAANYSGSDSFTYKANDGDANSNLATVNITVISASTLIEALADKVQALVDSGVLKAGNGNALLATLGNAQKKITSGQTSVAINMLNAFINQVSGFSGNQLTSAQAQTLIDNANAIIVALSNGGSVGAASVDMPSSIQAQVNRLFLPLVER
ncbi:MAG: tandem-95 repeat protein [Caldilineaceae bacterium]|nr:tandem-95 repeat protein [Caldilineaceae bacterium]